MSICLPDFLGIGAPRCGTRWLAACLAEHPEIALPDGEIYFFTRRRVVCSFWDRGLEWYAQELSKCRRPAVRKIGEITPTYILDDDSPGLIASVVPNVKLIACLRDQCERAYSWYKLFLRLNPAITPDAYPFRQFLTYQTEVFGREGFYLEHLQRYLAHFPRESLLILLYDDLLKEPRKYIQRVFEFLGVDSSFVPSHVGQRINESSERTREGKPRQPTMAGMRASSILKLPRFFSERKAQLPPKEEDPIGPEVRKLFSDLYRQHNAELGQLLGRDLRHWNTPGAHSARGVA